MAPFVNLHLALMKCFNLVLFGSCDPESDTRAVMTLMKTLLTSLASFLLLLSVPALACDYPARAKIASGATATKEEMIASQKSVKAYLAAMDEYLACIEEEEQAARAELVEPDQQTLLEREEVLTKKHNAAVEEMEIVAAEFNEQVRAYKEKSD